MSAAPKIPVRMNIADFFAWAQTTPGLWQLVDGEPQAMAPASVTHGAIQNELGRLIANHLDERSRRCRVLANPGVIPRVQSETNVRIPDLAVDCPEQPRDEPTLSNPVLVIEILSPSNQAETWANVWTYTSIPSVMEILVLKTTMVSAELLRRNKDGSWPQQPILITAGDLTLESIGFCFPLAATYRTSHLATQSATEGGA